VSILLVNPPVLSPIGGTFESFISGQKRRLTPQQYYSLPIEHLGLMAVAAYARTQGIEVRVVNGMVCGHSSLAQTWQAIRDAVAEDPPVLIGLTNIDTYAEVCWLAAHCRETWGDVLLVLGNSFATLNYAQVLDTCPEVDFVVIGDGEEAFTELARATHDGGSHEKIPGLAWRAADGSVRHNPPVAVDIGAMPWAARDELPAVLHAGFAAAIATTRGCLYRCTFCGTGATSRLFGHDGYRIRPLGDVIDEIEFLVTNFGIEFLSISDDLFLSRNRDSQQRAASFASELIRRGIALSFMIDARIDGLRDIALIRHLARAGLRRVFVGLETGSREQLLAYRKRQLSDDEDVIERIREVQDAGVEVIPGTIMFHPTVEPGELRETLRVLKAVGYRAPGKLIDRIVPYPGTPLHHDYARKGFLTQDWPIGRWNFADPLARRAYDRIAAYVKLGEASFEAAEAYFLAELAQWETQASADRSAVLDQAGRE
jgi:radical SAM superfamily enzyme YgiQ (UPF0313 family)